MAQMRLRPLGRLGYWQGQELRSSDLRAQVGALQQLRWWHNRAAHGVFGVSQRLSVSVDSTDPTLVDVDCGLAYDCFGRELLLKAPATIPLPAVTTAQYLVLAYSEGSAALVWISQNDFRASLGVPLATFRVVQGAYVKDPAFRAPLARALSRPRLAAGSTVPGNTPWEPLPNDAGLKVLVDTSAAGFTVTPFYLTTLNWQEENTEFSTPIVSVINPSEDSFTLQLLVKNIGRELLAVVSGAGLVDTLDLPNTTIHFRAEAGFGPSQDFQTNDVLTRLIPQADLALPVATVQNQAITLGLTSPNWQPQNGDAIVLGSLPAVTQVQAALQQTIAVTNPAVFPKDFLIIRMAGAAAGSAAVVADQTSNGTLILRTPLAGLAAGDQVGTVAEVGTVTLKDATGKLVLLTPPADLTGRVVYRKSSQMDREVPTTVVSSQADGTLKLKANIGLADGDTLYAGAAAGSVNSIGTSLTVANAAGIQPGDLVGIGANPAANSALVASIDGQQLIFTVPVQASVQDPVVNADFPARSTVLWNFGAFLGVNNANLFQPKQVVARLKGTRALSSAVLVSSPFSGILETSAPMASLAAGDVLGAARFSRTGTVRTVGAGSLPVGIQLQSAAQAAFFRQGDIVANLNSTQPFTLAVVDHVTADTVFLRTAIADLVAGNTLGIVVLSAVAVVTDPIPDATHFSVDDADAARAGGVVARFTGWRDAASPVTVQTAGASLVLNSVPDGLMVGDAVGFAALSIAQPKIRFDAEAKIQLQAVQVQGVDENTGSSVQANAIVAGLNNQLATLRFNGASGFMLRPEEVQITESSHIEDFLAYAQRNGLCVCWLGCQMPETGAPSCPGPSPAPCGCE